MKRTILILLMVLHGGCVHEFVEEDHVSISACFSHLHQSYQDSLGIREPAVVARNLSDAGAAYNEHLNLASKLRREQRRSLDVLVREARALAAARIAESGEQTTFAQWLARFVLAGRELTREEAIVAVVILRDP